MAPAQAKKSGTRKLSEVAKRLVIPTGIVSEGWTDVRNLCTNKLGLGFDAWQDGAGRLILAKRTDGKLACMIGGVGMSLPRQVGKTYLIAALVFGLCILRPGLLVIWSAHHSKTHGETFLSMQNMAKRSKIAPYILQVFTGSGDEEIRFTNGSRILFGARERGFGRGIPGVDVIVSDEAQIMSDKALDAQLATMNTSLFGLAIYVGTPPRPDDPSEAFTRMRTEAVTGVLEDAVWIELGADKGANIDDREQWAKANPSYPHRTPVESILRLRRKLSADSFLREGLGVWDEDHEKVNVFGAGKWANCMDPEPASPSLEWLGLAVSIDLQSASIIGAGKDLNGRRVVKPLAHGRGLEWVADTAAALREKYDVPAVIDGKGPGAVLLPALRVVFGKKLHEAVTEDVLNACAGIDRLVQTSVLSHADYPELNAAVDSAVKRDVGDRWAWGRRKSAGDISPLEAATLAVWAVENVKPEIAPKPDIF